MFNTHSLALTRSNRPLLWPSHMIPAMDNPISASYKWSADELLTAQRIHMRHSRLGRKIRRGTLIFGPLAVLIGIAIFVTRGFHGMGLFLTVVGTALLLSQVMARQMTLKHFSKRPDRDMIVSWEFRPDHITTKTEASSATLEWRMIARVLQTSRGFLLYPNDQVFHWVPTHAFRHPADLEAFKQLAKSKVQRFDHVA